MLMWKRPEDSAQTLRLWGHGSISNSGVLLDTMRVDSSDEEVEIRVRLPENYRILSTLDTLKVRTKDGLIPLSNFITKSPVKKLVK